MIDGHIHFGAAGRLEELKAYLDQEQIGGVDRVGIVSLPFREGLNFNPELILAKRCLPGRVDILGSFDHWSPERAPLEEQAQAMIEMGFDGLKLWEGKPELQAELGLSIDDPALLAAYRKAAEAGIPVLIHVADPPLFWERTGGPWSYVGKEVPGFDELIEQAERVCRAVPEGRFIFPHLLFLAGDVPRMAGFLDDYPNAYLDLAPGRYLYPDLGGGEKRRRMAASFFSDYAPRIIFGTDALFLSLQEESGEIEGLPGQSLKTVRRGTRMLELFLAREEEFANPFPLSKADIPLITGLGLNQGTLEWIFARSYLELFGVRPRPLREQQAAAYLDGFRERFSERIEEIEGVEP